MGGKKQRNKTHTQQSAVEVSANKRLFFHVSGVFAKVRFRNFFFKNCLEAKICGKF